MNKCSAGRDIGLRVRVMVVMVAFAHPAVDLKCQVTEMMHTVDAFRDFGVTGH